MSGCVSRARCRTRATPCALLWRAPWFTAAAALTLAIGIGVNTAMFAVVYGVLIRPLPYADAERLHFLFQARSRVGRTRVTPLDFVDLHAQLRSMRTAAVVGNGFTFTGHGDPELAIGHLVSGEFFELLGVTPAWDGRLAAPTKPTATTMSSF